VGLE